MQIMSLMTALPGAAAQGLIWGIMAIGVYITFRILDIADLTVDGTLCTGGAVCIMMMLSGHLIHYFFLFLKNTATPATTAAATNKITNGRIWVLSPVFTCFLDVVAEDCSSASFPAVSLF